MLKSLTSFFLTFIFSMNSFASAYTPNPETTALHLNLTQTYTKLSQEQKLHILQKFQVGRPQKEQEMIKLMHRILSRSSFPTLESREDYISFIDKGNQFPLAIVSSQMVLLNGVLIELGPGKLEESMRRIEKILLASKSVSAFDLLIPSAHASLDHVLLILGAIITAVAAIGSVFFTPSLILGAIGIPMVLHASKNLEPEYKDDLRKICSELTVQVQSQIESISSTDHQKLKGELEVAREKLKQGEGYKNPHSTFHSTYMEVDTCLNKLQKELQTSKAAINANERTQIKDVPEKGRAKDNLKNVSQQ